MKNIFFTKLVYFPGIDIFREAFWAVGSLSIVILTVTVSTISDTCKRSIIELSKPDTVFNTQIKTNYIWQSIKERENKQ